MFILRTDDTINKFEALSLSHAIIEFASDGTVVMANANFLKLMEYSLEEIRGQRHGIFVEPSYQKSAEYTAF